HGRPPVLLRVQEQGRDTAQALRVATDQEARRCFIATLDRKLESPLQVPLLDLEQSSRMGDGLLRGGDRRDARQRSGGADRILRFATAAVVEATPRLAEALAAVA